VCVVCGMCVCEFINVCVLWYVWFGVCVCVCVCVCGVVYVVWCLCV